MASVLFLFFNLSLSVLVVSYALSSSSAASQQSKFWSQNVDGNMPKSILSKLSPLSESETEVFTPLISQKYFSSNPKFCTTANLVCSAVVNPPPPGVKIYNFGFTGKVDPSSFFRLLVLKKGHKVTMPSHLDSQLPNRSFLPPEIARNIPLNASELQRIFPTAFSIPLTKAAMDKSLGYCNAPAVKGERGSCLKTLEDMIQFSRENLGGKHLAALTSDYTKGMGNQVVMIGNVKPYKTNKIIACHEIFFPFATYYCYKLPSTRIYDVDVANPKKMGTMNKFLVICHMDTSGWTPKHVAFKLLKLSPGKGEVCHWITQMDLIWIGYD
ncbi:PREDICTED: BURP domain-containing protein 16-like [Ipomoea nil]|uniref:BURP domain-containing protein 16-like n=1 Tax=Ipomoea nil TaxID=35883 RepID=UPI000900BC82|nr:PREDICTED: BURP domain-containing protein 16-like [Ipomoea nil]